MGVYCSFPITSAGLALLSLTRHGAAGILRFHCNWAAGVEGVEVASKKRLKNLRQ